MDFPASEEIQSVKVCLGNILQHLHIVSQNHTCIHLSDTDGILSVISLDACDQMIDKVCQVLPYPHKLLFLGDKQSN